MSNSYKYGFMKQACAAGLSTIEAEVAFDKYAADALDQGVPPAGMPHAGAGMPPEQGMPPSPHGHGGGKHMITIDGQELPPELADIVMHILQQVTQGGAPGSPQSAGGPPPGAGM